MDEPPSQEQLLARYRPVFVRIAEGAVERERSRTLPFEQVGWLRETGFTAVSVPREYGGQGADLVQLFGLLVDLAEADSNLPQLLRSHFSFIEQAQTTFPPSIAQPLLERAAVGTIFGNASHERGPATVGQFATVGVQDDDGDWTLNGTKYYSTGSLFADEVFVPARVGDGVRMFVVPATAPGVTLRDDWDGFGQRLTGSGTTVFEDVRLPDDAVLELASSERTHITAFAQVLLLAVLAGIARAAVRDAAEFVRTRTRSFSHASAATAAADPLVQGVVGRASAVAYAAESTVLAAVGQLQMAHDAVVARAARADERIEQAEFAAVRAQLPVIDHVLEVTTLIFEVGGASATSVTRQWDRHWRNARTVACHNPAIYQARLIGDHVINELPSNISGRPAKRSLPAREIAPASARRRLPHPGAGPERLVLSVRRGTDPQGGVVDLGLAGRAAYGVGADRLRVRGPGKRGDEPRRRRTSLEADRHRLPGRGRSQPRDEPVE